MMASWLPEPPKLSFAIFDLNWFLWEEDLAFHYIMCQNGKSSLLFVVEMNGSYGRFKALLKWG